MRARKSHFLFIDNKMAYDNVPHKKFRSAGIDRATNVSECCGETIYK